MFVVSWANYKWNRAKPPAACQAPDTINLKVELHTYSTHYPLWPVMDIQDAQDWLNDLLNEISVQFQKVPGSAIFLRYVKSSYQNDPVRSAVELFLVLFAIRYLLSPKYSTQKKSFVKLSEEVCDQKLRDGDTGTHPGNRRSTSWWTNGPLSLWSQPRHLSRRQRMTSDQ